MSNSTNTLPTSFTMSFWVIKIDDNTNRMSSNSFDIINAFGRFYFMANNTNPSSKQHSIFCKFATSTTTSLTLPAVNRNDLSVNTWVKISISA